MKKTTIVLAVLFFSNLHIQAQFTDNMESYTLGEGISQDHWTEWDCVVGIGCNIISNSDLAHTGTLSGIIPGDGTTKAVLDLGNKIYGGWGLQFWAYIPSGKEAIFSLQANVPIGDDNSIVGDILFNPGLNSPGSGKITDTFLGEISFDFPHDEWFRIIMNWDIYAGINLATWELWIDDLEVIPAGTVYANALGVPASSLGGVLFSSASLDNEIYLDDFDYESVGFICFPIEGFLDDMEYESGDPLGYWWSNIEISTGQGNSGTRSGVIPDDGITDVILDLGNTVCNNMNLEFYMYVPSNKVAYWNIQGEVPVVGSGEYVVGNFFFNQDNNNPGSGLIDDTHMGDVTFDFPHDQWFPVSMNFDLTQGMSNATWGISVDDVEVLPIGSPFTNEVGDIPTSLGGINFFSISTDNFYYLDDISYNERLLSIPEFSENSFTVYPNPTNDVLYINSSNELIGYGIYSLQGVSIFEGTLKESIDVSNLVAGVYFIEITTDASKSVQKFIKN